MGDGQVSKFVQVCKANQEVSSSSVAAEPRVDELCCLSGEKPFFDIVLSKSHVSTPYAMVLTLFLSYFTSLFQTG